MGSRSLHVQAIVLPDGELRDLWVHDGILVEGPLADAVELPGGWILPGLVDAHCHVGLDGHGGVDRETSARQARVERQAGVLLLRDAGSPVDTHWIDERADLPRIVRAGSHIARPKRYLRNYAAEVEPADLVAEVERQVAAGDGWIKLVGDWIDRAYGDLAPLWAPEVAQAAITKAHELGARVTAHCFAEESAAELVRAGIDGIEHGTGLDEATIELMAERQVALVPTMVNLETFPAIAAQGEQKFPRYGAHMRALHARRHDTMAAAVAAGVPVYAGTDAGGSLAHGLIATEIRLLAEISSNEYALGAASWRAREWLGSGQLAVGDSADFVIYDQDPRLDLAILDYPRVVLRGNQY